MPVKNRDLEIFDAVARSGSIQNAADRMGLTQSAVSRVIYRLEHDLKCVLLDRSIRPLKLTRDGENALLHARKILASVRDMESAFRNDALLQGPFRIGVPHALTFLMLDDDTLLGLQQFPHLRPAFVAGWSDDLLAKLSAHELDAAILITRRTHVPENAVPLAFSRVHMVGASSMIAHATNLEKANHIGWALNTYGCGYRKALLLALQRLGLTPNIVLETNALELQLQFARAGRAFTLAPTILQNATLPLEGLDFFDMEELNHPVAIVMHSHDTRGAFGTIYETLEERLRQRLTDIL